MVDIYIDMEDWPAGMIYRQISTHDDFFDAVKREESLIGKFSGEYGGKCWFFVKYSVDGGRVEDLFNVVEHCFYVLHFDVFNDRDAMMEYVKSYGGSYD